MSPSFEDVDLPDLVPAFLSEDLEDFNYPPQQHSHEEIDRGFGFLWSSLPPAPEPAPKLAKPTPKPTFMNLVINSMVQTCFSIGPRSLEFQGGYHQLMWSIARKCFFSIIAMHACDRR